MDVDGIEMSSAGVLMMGLAEKERKKEGIGYGYGYGYLKSGLEKNGV